MMFLHRQLLQQRLRLLQIARVKPLREPVNRSLWGDGSLMSPTGHRRKFTLPEWMSADPLKAADSRFMAISG
jgi:hypothetical protein